MRHNDTNIQSVQIMRGIASLLVVLLHISIKGNQYNNGALSGFAIGGSGVDLFFIISGYIMCVSTFGRSMNFSRFMLHRIRRIMPLYWLTTTAALIVFLYAPQVVNTSGGETSIWASYVLFPNGKRFLNSNGWTLSYEFFYYLIFGIFLTKGTYKAIAGSSLILGILAIIGVLTDPNAFLTNILYLEFIFGMSCFYFFNKRQLPFPGILLCLAGCLLLTAASALNIPDQELWRGFYWGIPMLLFFAGFLALEDRIRQNHSLVKKLFLGIGNSSYSLYLVHPFALSGAAMGLKHFGLTGNPFFFTAVLLTTAIITGHLVYLYVERPLTGWVRTIQAKAST